MLSGFLDKRITRLGIIGIYQFLWRKGGTALLALVAVSFRRMTTGTFTFNIAVGQEMTRLLVVELLADLLDELSFVVELTEEVAGKLVVGLARRAAIDIEGDAEALEAVLDKIVIAVHYLLNGDAFLAGTDGDRHAVFVATADKEALTPFETQVAGIDVCRHVNASKVADMDWSVGIGQSGRYKGSLEMLFQVILN